MLQVYNMCSNDEWRGSFAFRRIEFVEGRWFLYFHALILLESLVYSTRVV